MGADCRRGPRPLRSSGGRRPVRRAGAAALSPQHGRMRAPTAPDLPPPAVALACVLLALISDVTRVLAKVQGLSLVLYGGLLVVIIAYLPNGLIDLFRRRSRPPRRNS